MVALREKLTRKPYNKELDGDTNRRRDVMKRLLGGRVLRGLLSREVSEPPQTQKNLPPLRILSLRELELLHGPEVYRNSHVGVALEHRDKGPK